MMKFFRKYNKQLLAVFASGLLVVWLGGFALRQAIAPKPGKTVLATAFGREIRRREFEAAGGRLRILAELGINVPKQISPKEWLLLGEEARRAGVVVTAEEVARLKQDPRVARAIDPIRRARHVAIDYIDTVLAEYLRIQKLASMMMWAAKISEPELRHIVRDAREQVRVRFVVFGADDFADPDEPVTEQELREQFERYKDVTPGGKGLGYGYRHPDRVQVEYIMADVSRIAPNIEIDPHDARQYWREHKQEFLQPATRPSSQPTTTSAAATNPATTSPTTRPVPYETFVEAKQAVFERMRKDKAREVAEEIIRELAERLMLPWLESESGPDGYKLPPPGVTAEDYYRRMLDLYAQDKPRFASALVRHRTGLLDRNQLRREPDIGQAFADAASGRISFAELAFKVQGLAPMPKAGSPEAPLYLALYQTAETILRDFRGNAYAYRIIRAEPSRPPASLDEVREQVEKDVRQLHAYRRAREYAEKFLAKARRLGVSKAWDQLDEEWKSKLGKQAGPIEPAPFARVDQWLSDEPPYIRGIGKSDRFVQTCFALGEQTPGSQASSAPATSPSTQPVRVKLVELPEQKRWVVVQWIETIHVPKDEYDRMRPFVARLLQERRGRTIAQRWFDPKRIAERTGFRYVNR